MSQINKNDIISDDALEAPLILRKNFESLLSTAKEFIGTAKQYDDSLKSGSKSSTEHRERTKELTDQQRVLAQITKQVATESAKQTQEYAALQLKLVQLREQTREKLKVDQEEAQTLNLKNSSIERLNQALEKNRQAYARLQGEHQRNSAEGKKLLSVIQEQDKALQSLHPAVKKAEGNIYLLSAALNKLGEGGVRTNEMLIHLIEAMTSGWSLAAAGIGLAAATLKNFFDTTEEGRIKMEVFEEQTITRWSIFKNKVAEATEAVLDFAEADEATRKYHEQQRVARMTPEQRKEYEKQLALDKASEDLVRSRVKLLEHEAEIEVDLADKRHEAIEAELLARKTNEDVKVRLDAITKANQLFNEVQLQENFLLKTRNQILIAEIHLRAQGRDLRADEKKQVSDLTVQYKEQQNAFLSASKRRTALEASLRKEVQDRLDKEAQQNRDFKIGAAQGKSAAESDEQKRIKGILTDADIEARNNKAKTSNDSLKKINDEYLNAVKDSQEEAKKEKERKENEEFERERDLIARKKQLAVIGADAITRIVDDQFNYQAAAHERYLERTRENYQEEMMMASGNKIAQAQLTTQFREREKREQLEMVKLKRRQAQFDRDVALLNIVIKTSEAVMSDLAKYGPAAGPFIAIDEAMGALQAAAILAKPLPSYEVGTLAHPGGPALVHPNELITYPDNTIAFTPDIPTVMDLPRNTQVDTQAETMRALALAGLTSSFKSDRSVINNTIVKELQSIRQELKQTKAQKTNFHSMMAGYYAFKQDSETFKKKIMIEKFGR